MRRWVELTLRRHRLNGSHESAVRIIETCNVMVLASAINALCDDGWTVVRADVRTQCDDCARVGSCDGASDTYAACMDWEARA